MTARICYSSVVLRPLLFEYWCLSGRLHKNQKKKEKKKEIGQHVEEIKQSYNI